jgi:hypothetical protein
MSRIHLVSCLFALGVFACACGDPEGSLESRPSTPLVTFGTVIEAEGSACDAATESVTDACTDDVCGVRYKASCVDGRWVCGSFYADCQARNE